MKPKYSISEERILQISNDISEEMCFASKKELIEVVLYFRDKYDEGFQSALAEYDKQIKVLVTQVSEMMGLPRPKKAPKK